MGSFPAQLRRWSPLALAITVVTCGLWSVHAPAPPLFGSLCGAIVVALRQQSPPDLPRALFRGGQAVIGATVAAQVDLSAMRELGTDWPAVAAVTLGSILLSVVVGQALRLHGVSASTALFASIAGGASGMSALARDYGADERVVVVVQYFRVLFILLTLPFAVALVFAPDVTRPGAAAAAAGPASHQWAYLVLTIAGGLALGRVAHLPSPAVLGCLVCGSALGFAPWFEHVQVPAIAQVAGFLVIGVQAGIRFTPRTVAALLRMFPTVFLTVLALVVGCGALGMLLAALTGESRLDSYLATSPGGLPVVLATVSDTAGNVTFVSGVQMLRMLGVLLLTPLVAGGLRRWRGPSER